MWRDEDFHAPLDKFKPSNGISAAPPQQPGFPDAASAEEDLLSYTQLDEENQKQDFRNAGKILGVKLLKLAFFNLLLCCMVSLSFYLLEVVPPSSLPVEIKYPLTVTLLILSDCLAVALQLSPVYILWLGIKLFVLDLKINPIKPRSYQSRNEMPDLP